MGCMEAATHPFYSLHMFLPYKLQHQLTVLMLCVALLLVLISSCIAFVCASVTILGSLFIVSLWFDGGLADFTVCFVPFDLLFPSKAIRLTTSQLFFLPSILFTMLSLSFTYSHSIFFIKLVYPLLSVVSSSLNYLALPPHAACPPARIMLLLANSVRQGMGVVCLPPYHSLNGNNIHAVSNVC